MNVQRYQSSLSVHLENQSTLNQMPYVDRQNFALDNISLRCLVDFFRALVESPFLLRLFLKITKSMAKTA